MGTLKLIEKDNRLFIESNVIMLSTGKNNIATPILKHNAIGTLYFNNKMKNTKTLGNWQHLYFTSDEEIKEGDWRMITDKESSLYGQFEQKKSKLPENDQWSKIIATTDQSLTEIRLIDGLDKDGYKVETIKQEFCLPQPSHKAIKALCEQGGFDKCLVEIESNCRDISALCTTESFANGCLSCDHTVKIDSRNTITIKPFVEKAYTQSEVEQILFNYANDQGLLSTKSDVEQFNSLIEDYL